MADDPEDRFASANEFRAELTRIYKIAMAKKEGDIPEIRSATPHGRRRRTYAPMRWFRGLVARLTTAKNRPPHAP